MIETGMVLEGAPVEMIEGHVIRMIPSGGEHIRCVMILNHLLFRVADNAFFVSPRGSIRLDLYSEPGPDFAILRSLPQDRIPPLVDDVALVIEVSDTSLLYDLNIKAPLYARAGIPEYWVVDLTAQRVLQHSQPIDGRYTVVDEFTDSEQITSMTEPPITIAVAEIFA